MPSQRPTSRLTPNTEHADDAARNAPAGKTASGIRHQASGADPHPLLSPSPSGRGLGRGSAHPSSTTSAQSSLFTPSPSGRGQGRGSTPSSSSTPSHASLFTRPSLRLTAALLLSAAALSLPACVTERVEPATPTLGAPARGNQNIGRSDTPTLPTGPVARPAATASTVQTAVRVAVQPIGHLDFDGQILPHIAPNARYIAAQLGEPPDWPTMLAEPGASAPRTRIAAHQIADTNRPLPINWPHDTRGLLLGRSADTRGVLIEAPRPDGSRWIGVLPWATGEVDWLVTTQQVNAHAVLVGNTLAWCQRDIGDDQWSIRVRDLSTGSEAPIQSNASLAFPLITPDERTVMAIAVGEQRLRAQFHAIERSSRGLRLGGMRARVDLGPAGDGLLRAYQAVQPAHILQPTPAVATGTARNALGVPSNLVLLYHPGLAAMAIIDAERGELTPLTPQSIAGAWNLDANAQLVGVFLTTPRGLEHQPILPPPRGRTLGDAGPTSRVLSQPFVPRLTNDPTRPYLLLGPTPRQPRRLTLTGMSLADEAEPRR